MISLLQSNDDKELLIHAEEILKGIETLNEPLSFKEIKVYNDIDTDLLLGEDVFEGGKEVMLSIEEMVSYFSNYMTIQEPNILEYKS